MATGGHKYTGVTGKITVGGAIEGYVEADLKLEWETGEYIELEDNVPVDHTFGKKKVSGKIKSAWGEGMNSGYMADWFGNKEEKNIVFDPGDGNATFTASGCILLNLSIGMKAGDAGPLMLDADFKGLDYSTTDTA